MKKSRSSKKLGASAPLREPNNEDGKPALVPKLRFPEFRATEGWKVNKLSSLVQLVSGIHLSPDQYSKEGEVPYFTGPSDFTNNIEAITKRTGDSTNLAKENDTLITVKGSGVGEIWYLTLPSVAIGRQLMAVRAMDASSRFVFQFLLTKRRRFEDLAAGNLIPGLSRGDILDLEAPFPERPEQQKIAECLSSVDELMEAQGRKVDALKTHKKGLMQQLFPREGETQPRLRFPEFQNAREWVLNSVGGLVEEGWLYPPKDGNHGNIHPKSSDYVATGIPFIMASDLNGGLIDIENCHFISKEQADTLQKGFAKEGDVLLSHKGTVGEVAVVREIKTPYLMLTPQVTYYRVKDRKKLSNEFLAQLFVADAFQSNLVEVSGGGTRAYIGITEQAKLRLQLPKDVTEQQRIASCLSSLDVLITVETQKLEDLKTHKKGLMQQLFPSPEEEDTL